MIRALRSWWLLRLLNSRDCRKRLRAARELGDRRETRADFDLRYEITRTREECRGLKRVAAEALAKIRGWRSEGSLIIAFARGEGHPFYSGPDYVQEMLNLIYPDWRRTDGARNVVPELIEMLRDDDYETQRRSAWALGMIGDGRAVPHLLERIWDGRVEWAVLHALKEIKDRRAVPGLVRYLQRLVELGIGVNSAPEVRLQCGVIDALEKLGDPRAIPVLESAMRDQEQDSPDTDTGYWPNTERKEAAKRAIARIRHAQLQGPRS